MSRDRDLVEYLRARPLDRLLAAARDRYRRLGRVGGTVPLAREEAAALAGLLGRVPQGDRLHLQRLDAALRSSGFGCSLPEALAAYFGEPVVTDATVAAAEAAAWQELHEALAAQDPTGWAAADAHHLRREWRRRPDALADAARLVVRALQHLPVPDEPLAVFAQRVAGDPHALDTDHLAGRLFLRALAHLYPDTVAAAASPAEARSARLAAAGLAVDDVSSTVLAAGLVGDDPLLRAARQSGDPLALPLRTVKRLNRVSGWHGVAFVVENPPVFSRLLDALADVPPPERATLLCTSGQPSLAARHLLDALVEGGTTLWYSGDRDPPGLAIARGLVRRYGERCRLWRMDWPVTVPSGAVADAGPVFQEALVPVLVADLREQSGARGTPPRAV